jgi:hypothetical protein
MMVPQNFNRRHSPNRRKTRVDATILLDGRYHAVTIRDVSFEGMKLQVPCPISPGSPITVHVLDQQIPAIVHWNKPPYAGIHMLERLDGQTLIALETADDDLAAFR